MCVYVSVCFDVAQKASEMARMFKWQRIKVQVEKRKCKALQQQLQIKIRGKNKAKINYQDFFSV